MLVFFINLPMSCNYTIYLLSYFNLNSKTYLIYSNCIADLTLNYKRSGHIFNLVR
jgi:hypothetical protein